MKIFIKVELPLLIKLLKNIYINELKFFEQVFESNDEFEYKENRQNDS